MVVAGIEDWSSVIFNIRDEAGHSPGSTYSGWAEAPRECLVVAQGSPKSHPSYCHNLVARVVVPPAPAPPLLAADTKPPVDTVPDMTFPAMDAVGIPPGMLMPPIMPGEGPTKPG